ncbi:MAG: NADH:ubiquinone reductase (Na(+)-transporting) subunit B [Tidjanibacter sp.]|nr:NADH:ubiquinone reductase (Na(+)-transporting) subunit B [Tidjanibacter sp.]
MKALRNFVDKIKPAFSKGGKFSALGSTFEGFETFLFVPNTVTKKGSHIRDCVDLKRVMIVVVLALLPAAIFGMYNVGLQHFRAFGDLAAAASIWQCFWFGFWKVLPIIVVSYVTGLAIEFAMAQIRGEEINEGFLVSGMIIPLVMPVDIPLWIVALGTAFAVVIGKEAFGGTGMNVFNPAILARAFVFFAYTSQISGDQVWVEGLVKGGALDSFSGATPLTQLADGLAPAALQSTPMDWFIGTIPGSIGETSFVAIMIGAAILLFTGVASWRTMLSVFAGGYLMGLVFNLIGANDYMLLPAHHHLLLGGFAFGAVFMATDPVTSAQTNCGKIIYGLMIGALAVLIRVVNPGYPEGMMLAILFMNGVAPLIDHYVVEANIRRRNKRVKLVK